MTGTAKQAATTSKPKTIASPGKTWTVLLYEVAAQPVAAGSAPASMVEQFTVTATVLDGAKRLAREQVVRRGMVPRSINASAKNALELVAYAAPGPAKKAATKASSNTSVVRETKVRAPVGRVR